MTSTLPPRPPRSTARRRIGAAGTGLLLTAALVSGAAACSSDDDASPSTTTDTTVHAHTVSAEACGAFAELSALTFQMPEDPNECFAFGADAFDLADRLQTPVFVMLDLDIGMNDWLCEPFKWDPARKMDRGKVLTAAGVKDGPLVETKEVIGGYMIVEAESYERALEIARECPGLIRPGSSCEAREIAAP